MENPQCTLLVASEADLDKLSPMVGRYHETEGIACSPGQRAEALSSLLCESRLGLVWLILCDGRTVGYIAARFCYSIEFGGRDAYIDEFFIKEEHRAKGFGTQVINLVIGELRRKGVRALSLEVGRDNHPAKALYSRCGFEARDRYSVMTRLL